MPDQYGNDSDNSAADIDSDSPTKVQDLAKAGHEDFDPNEGAD